VNKVNSKAVLRWDIVKSTALPDDVRARFLARYATRITNDGELLLSSDAHREQSRNEEECIARLVRMLEVVLYPPKKRRATAPGKGAVERRLKEKKARGKTKAKRSAIHEDES
jgi:ribosome-associated protein